MALEIKDGHGTGHTLKVDDEGRALVLAVGQTWDYHINTESGKVWSIPFENASPTGGDDYILYIKNTGDKDLRITDVRLSSGTAASQVELHHVSGTASAGTPITAVPRKLGSTATPAATIEYDANFTGLANEGVLFFMQLAAVDTEYHLRTTSNVIITKGTAVALIVETSTAVITGNISIVESE